MIHQWMAKSLLLLSFFQVLSLCGVEYHAYFNRYEGATYKDPYRGISKQGHDLEEVILQSIKKAQKRVYLAVQEFRLPRIALALAELKAKGVDVRVVIENNYNNSPKSYWSQLSEQAQNVSSAERLKDLFLFIDLNGNRIITHEERSKRDALYILRKASIPVKDDTYDNSKGSGLMHHKFVIIDDEELILSSANFTMSGIHGDYHEASSYGNHNALIKVNDAREMVSSFENEFYYLWGAGFNGVPRFGVSKPYRGAIPIPRRRASAEVQFSPAARGVSWSQTTNGLIAKTLSKARSEVLMSLFVFSDQGITDALLDRKKKNPAMSIELITESKFAYRPYSESLDLWGLELYDEFCLRDQDNLPWTTPYLRQRVLAGVAKHSPHDLLHHKFAVVDQRYVIFGSHNWTESANYLNDEFVVIIDDAKIAREFRTEFFRLRKEARFGAPRTLLQRIQDQREICYP